MIDYLKDYHQIEIQLDKRAMDDAGIGTDTPVTKSLKGVSLKSALRLMLPELNLTYVIKDEVLLITTTEAAENMLTTRVVLGGRPGDSDPARRISPAVSAAWAAWAALAARTAASAAT